MIKTTGLILRPLARSDAERLAYLCNDKTLARQTSRLPFPYTLENAIEFIERSINEAQTGEEYRFGAYADDTLVACTGVMPTAHETFELGYWVGRDARGKGVATRAATAILIYAFNRLKAQTMTAGYFHDNPASARVLEKLGFRRTGEIVKTFSRGRNADVDTIRMTLARDDFAPRYPVEMEDVR
ncbi:MAG: GNAT family N-acetyltransferase [Pseudomonadota bacterium]